MVVEVELLEAGDLPIRQAVEVRWEEVSGLSGWWLLTAAPLLLVFVARAPGRRGWRGLRAWGRVG
jgi:hypothetical protein